MQTPAYDRRVIDRTVLGDIAPADLVPSDAHEHLFLDTPAQPNEEFLDPDKAVEEAATLRDAGARSLVDWTPLGLGRDLDGLAHVSHETGLHVVAATGLHRDAHYLAEDDFRTATVERLTELFVDDLGGRCGIIKAGASYPVLTPFEQTVCAPTAAAPASTTCSDASSRGSNASSGVSSPTASSSRIRPGRSPGGRLLAQRSRQLYSRLHGCTVRPDGSPGGRDGRLQRHRSGGRTG